MTRKEEQAVLIFERKIIRMVYGAKYEDGEWKSRTNRELEELRRKYGKMDKGAKDKLAGLPGENGGE
jgi:predicted aminopeptidase